MEPLLNLMGAIDAGKFDAEIFYVLVVVIICIAVASRFKKRL